MPQKTIYVLVLLSVIKTALQCLCWKINKFNNLPAH